MLGFYQYDFQIFKNQLQKYVMSRFKTEFIQ